MIDFSVHRVGPGLDQNWQWEAILGPMALWPDLTTKGEWVA